MLYVFNFHDSIPSWLFSLFLLWYLCGFFFLFCLLKLFAHKKVIFFLYFHPSTTLFFFHSTNFLDNLIHSHYFNYNQFAPFVPPWVIGTPNLVEPLILLLGLTSLPLFSSIMGDLDLTIPLVTQLQMQVLYFSLTTWAHAPDLINQWGLHIYISSEGSEGLS